jgi:hypothetical protein
MKIVRTETKIVTSTLMMEAAGSSVTLVATERLNVVINQDDSLKFSPAWKLYVWLRCKTELQEFIFIIFVIRSSLFRRNISCKSAVGIASSYGLSDRGVGVPSPGMARFFSTTQGLDRLWVPGALSRG